RAILVDAVFYPGFSGGSLVATRGAVLGMNTSGLGAVGANIAVAWRLAMQIATAIVEHGRVTRGYLGIGTQPIQLEGSLSEAAGQDRGLLVVHVAEGSPAASAGFLQGDILIKLDGMSVPGAEPQAGTFTVKLGDSPEPDVPPPAPDADMVVGRGVRRMRRPGLPHPPIFPFMYPVPPPPP